MYLDIKFLSYTSLKLSKKEVDAALVWNYGTPKYRKKRKYKTRGSDGTPKRVKRPGKKTILFGIIFSDLSFSSFMRWNNGRGENANLRAMWRQIRWLFGTERRALQIWMCGRSVCVECRSYRGRASYKEKRNSCSKSTFQGNDIQSWILLFEILEICIACKDGMQAKYCVPINNWARHKKKHEDGKIKHPKTGAVVIFHAWKYLFLLLSMLKTNCSIF